MKRRTNLLLAVIFTIIASTPAIGAEPGCGEIIEDDSITYHYEVYEGDDIIFEDDYSKAEEVDSVQLNSDGNPMIGAEKVVSSISIHFINNMRIQLQGSVIKQNSKFVGRSSIYVSNRSTNSPMKVTQLKISVKSGDYSANTITNQPASSLTVSSFGGGVFANLKDYIDVTFTINQNGSIYSFKKHYDYTD